MARTIFLSIYDGDTERVILRTDVFKTIRASGAKIVLLIKGKDRLEYYRETFGSEQVTVELLPPALTRKERLWYHASWSTIPTRAVTVRRRREFAADKRVGRYLASLILWTLGHSRAWREFLRALYGWTGESYAIDLFEKYQPDLLFAPNMFSPEDLRLLLTAKRRGVRTITTVKSWDVLTTKAFTRVKADRVLVFNQYNADEAVRYGDYRAEQVTVCGFPQFDAYHDASALIPRDEFFRTLGIDPKTHLILYAIPGDWKSPYTKDILIALDREIDTGKFDIPIVVLARLHPKYPDTSEGTAFKHIVMERPGTYFKEKQGFGIDSGSQQNPWTFTEKDNQHLINSLYHSDVIVVTDSTMALDAAAMDRPAIVIGYDGSVKLPYWPSIRSIYERDHYRNLLALGATPLVESDAELQETITKFLRDPDYLRAEREQLQQRFLYKNDGHSGERMGRAVLAALPQ